jgi:hypothetical protein
MCGTFKNNKMLNDFLFYKTNGKLVNNFSQYY